MSAGIRPTSFVQVRDGDGQGVEGAVPVEEQVVLTVNAIDLVGLMCTPVLLEELAIGFLFNEGLIDGMEDVASARACGTGRCIDVWLHKDIDPPKLRTITSGCSGGTTFESLVDTFRVVASELRVTSGQISDLMRQLQETAILYRQARGIHASALATETELLCLAEDVGRHNTLDKLTGSCLRRGLEMRDRILLTSGRVSSEMLSKAARMSVPVIVSLTSPTSLSVELALAWDITLVGYARGSGFRVYAGAQRIDGLEDAGASQDLTDAASRG
jgi:FdhD protein